MDDVKLFIGKVMEDRKSQIIGRITALPELSENEKYKQFEENVLKLSECCSVSSEELAKVAIKLSEYSVKSASEAFRNMMESLNETSREIQSLGELVKQTKLDVDKQIECLERRKKHCNNFLELKQIDRELNVLKFKYRKKG